MNSLEGHKMAEQVIRRKVDDLERSRGRQVAAEEQLSFGLDGIDYLIDLSEANAKDLRGKLQEFIDAATPVMDLEVTEGMTPREARKAESRAIRAWAARQGQKVNGRGRISHEVLAKYVRVHGPLRYH